MQSRDAGYGDVVDAPGSGRPSQCHATHLFCCSKITNLFIVTVRICFYCPGNKIRDVATWPLVGAVSSIFTTFHGLAVAAQQLERHARFVEETWATWQCRLFPNPVMLIQPIQILAST